MVLDRDELRAIALGKFKASKCPCCDNEGRVWYDGETGLGAGPNVPIGISEENIASEPCDNCEGVGFTIRFF